MGSILGAKVLGSIATIIVGGIVASATVLGLVQSQVNSAGDNPGNSDNPSIDYGSSN